MEPSMIFSHQLRTAVTSINWVAEVMRSDSNMQLLPPQQRFLDYILAENFRTADSIEGLTTIFELDSLVQPLQITEIDLNLVHQRVINRCNFQSSSKKNVKVTFTYDKTLPLVTKADESVLELLLYHLYRNVLHDQENEEALQISCYQSLADSLNGKTRLSLKFKQATFKERWQSASHVETALQRGLSLREVDLNVGLFLAKRLVSKIKAEVDLVYSDTNEYSMVVTLPTYWE